MRKVMGTLMGIGLAFVLVGCGGLGTGPNTTSRVRLLNALIGGPSGGVNIVQRGMPVNTQPLLYGQILPSANGGISAYYTVVSGGDAITGTGVNTDVYAAPAVSGTPLAPEASFLLSPHTPGQSDGTYTIIVAGIVGQTGAEGPTLFRAIDNVPSISYGTTNAYLRVINLAPDTAGTAGITLLNNGLPIQGLTNISYGTPSSSSNYVPLSVVAGSTFDFSVVAAGSNTPIPTQSDISHVTLQAGHAYTMFFIGEVNPINGAPHFDVILTEDQ
ncbi:hypothetical protein CWRG_01602 [Chthonomonas calidirosea]|uniref:DUF4397 domain-containing protein n=1 Tax=Chthonomonas calidirosea (strain DSM 23976 / ICMP 18418 / T49) TaxID=1303518 RepID=S0EWY6_CHTCT|nr:DUF4397 domain-containing protein [Chthonomonas calidirosea]CCW36271.1 hypothetical protein CCALI_02473 [Chthonomonas calidirosea T49]CEK16766.1 hypothetical protein CWRG_01602 [Chthonomonas calidirosea]CEK17829.1 hypothetical protein CTKA_01619 [Chthonomonas calidirosea]